VALFVLYFFSWEVLGGSWEVPGRFWEVLGDGEIISIKGFPL